MFAHDAGHSHGPTPHLVTGCPLCDADKTARDQAIAHLTEALRILASIRPDDARPTRRINVAPIGVTGDDTHLCHNIDLTAKQAEGLSDAIDSLSAYAATDLPATPPLTAGADREAIPSGEWSAAAVAQHSRDMYAEITDFLDSIDPISLLDDVLNSDRPGQAAEAYEQLTGEWDGEL
jgi:hypothetical protein